MSSSIEGSAGAGASAVSGTVGWARLERVLASRCALACSAALALLLAARSIEVGFLSDDYAFRARLHSASVHAPAVWDLFRFASGSQAGHQLQLRAGLVEWWAAPDLKIHFLRPLTSLEFALNDALFGDFALGYHLMSLFWLGSLLVAVGALFRRLLPPAAATMALAIYGLAAAHVEAYAWVSARHALLAATFGACALALRTAARGRWVAWPALLIALGCSESGLAVLPLWAALELTREQRPLRSRWLQVACLAALGLGYLLSYAALGGGVRASGAYHDPLSAPLAFLAVAALRLPVLLGNAALGLPAELAHVVAEWKLALVACAASGLVALAWYLTRERSPRSPAASGDAGFGAGNELDRRVFWLVVAGVAGCLVGTSALPSGRVLMIPDLAFAPWLGLILLRGFAARGLARSIALVLTLAHLVIAPMLAQRTMGRMTQRARSSEALAAQIAGLLPASGVATIVAASDPLVFLYPRGILAQLWPQKLRCMSTWSAARSGQRFTRTGERSLQVETLERPLLDGSFDRLYRASDRPFHQGDSFEQCGARIEVTGLQKGLPSQLSIRTRRSLDDPAQLLLIWRNRQLERFLPPALGQSIVVAWSPGPSGVF